MSKTKIGGIIQNRRLSAIWILGVADRPGIAATALCALADKHIAVQFIAQLIDSLHQDHLCLCIDRDELETGRRQIESVAAGMGAQSVEASDSVALISIFGPDFRVRPGIGSEMFGALAGQGINILAISTSISTVSCLIDEQHIDRAVEALQHVFDLP